MAFPFFSLPGEIRNLIYRELLVLPQPIDICFTSETPIKLAYHAAPLLIANVSCRNINRQFKLHPGILHANRAIHHEATWFLYSENQFRFYDNYRIVSMIGFIQRHFLEVISLKNANYLHQLNIPFPRFYPISRNDSPDTEQEAHFRLYEYTEHSVGSCLVD